ncbi:hypothetical protein H8959_000005 [Pygathrix nigripes]
MKLCSRREHGLWNPKSLPLTDWEAWTGHLASPSLFFPIVERRLWAQPLPGCCDDWTPSTRQHLALRHLAQVNYILESRASTARADYFAQKQRKLNRRTSFSFQKEKKSGQQ